MKTITTFLFLIVSLVVNAQNTYVPDDNFEQYLITLGYDDVMDDYVLTSKINTITTLNIARKGVVDLTGINDFIALKELDISNQSGSLSVVDLSGLIHLEKLDARYNDIASIDLSNNVKLVDLNLEHNKLASLDLSALIDLEILTLNDNQLKVVDLANQPKLYKLYAIRNSIENVTFSPASKATLSDLQLSYNQLTSIDITGCTSLFKVLLDNNQLTSITSLFLPPAIITIDYLSCNDNKMENFVVNSIVVKDLNVSNNPGIQLSYANSGSIENLHIGLAKQNRT